MYTGERTSLTLDRMSSKYHLNPCKPTWFSKKHKLTAIKRKPGISIKSLKQKLLFIKTIETINSLRNHKDLIPILMTIKRTGNNARSVMTPNKAKLLELLSSFSKLFSGDLGRYVHKKFSIALKDPNSPPIFCYPYPIPMIHQQVFKKELEHLIEAKVLQRIERSEWAIPTFLIPKKDGRVRWISDFRHLDKLLTRPRYFLPK